MRSHKPDPDDMPEQTAADFARAVKIADGPDALSHYMRSEARKVRGPQKAPTKQVVTIRLSRNVVNAYKGTGRGWHTRIDEDLQRAAQRLLDGVRPELTAPERHTAGRGRKATRKR